LTYVLIPVGTIPIIRNAELLLLRAEALARRNNTGDLDDAEGDINVIRSAAGLGDFNSSGDNVWVSFPIPEAENL